MPVGGQKSLQPARSAMTLSSTLGADRLSMRIWPRNAGSPAPGSAPGLRDLRSDGSPPLAGLPAAIFRPDQAANGRSAGAATGSGGEMA
jgi:hypothetical protein